MKSRRDAGVLLHGSATPEAATPEAAALEAVALEAVARESASRGSALSESVMRRVALSVLVGTAALAGCEQGATAPESPIATIAAGDPVAGQVAFVQNCAQCHATRDGYDLAAFGFSSFDVMRRSLGHIDSTTSRNITSYIETLRPGAPLVGTPFQPSGRVGASDREYWIDALGTSGWPTDLTPEALRGINPRDLKVPLAMPEWSLEGSLEDWMPDTPLPPEVLDFQGGAIRYGLEAYYADPTEANLLAAIEPFAAATETPGRLCTREEPEPCFDARRWMASLGGQHYLRTGQIEDVPVEVARIWWSVGESAIALPGEFEDVTVPYEGFDRLSSTYIIGARWLYLAYSFHPEAFNEPGRYMGAFLREEGLHRVSVFAALRRMVGDGPAHQEHSDQFLQDGLIALESSDYEVAPGVAEFVFEYYIERLESGDTPGLDAAAAREWVARAWVESKEKVPAYTPSSDRVNELRLRVLELLEELD